MGWRSGLSAGRVILASLLGVAACGIAAPSADAGDPGPIADLAITITNGVATAVSGETVTYTITATNSGPSDAESVSLSAGVPAPYSCTASGGGTCTAAGSGPISDIVNLPVGATVTYTATDTVPDFTPSRSIGANLSWSGGTDANPGNNAAWDEDTIVERADLSLTMAASASATVGTAITYTLTLVNSGPSQTLDWTLEQNLPDGTTFVSAIGPSQFVFTTPAVGAGGAVTAEVTENVPVGSPITLTVVALVAPGAVPGSVLESRATTSGTSDTNDTNNAASAATRIESAAAPTAPTTAPSGAPTSRPTGSSTTAAPVSTTIALSTTTAPSSTTTVSTTTSSTTTLPGQRPTTTTVTSSLNPSFVSQPVTFTATVAMANGTAVGFRAVAPRVAPPGGGGTIEFRDGDTVLGVVPVEGGTATLTTSALSAGVHTITATFSGSATVAPSAATVVQQVDAATLPASR